MLASDGRQSKEPQMDDGLRAQREAFDLLNPSKSKAGKKLSYQRGMRSNLLWRAFIGPSSPKAAADSNEGEMEIRDMRMRSASSPAHIYPRKSIPHQRGARGAILSTMLHGLIGTSTGEEHRNDNQVTADGLRQQSRFFNDAEVQLRSLDETLEPQDGVWTQCMVAVDERSILHLFEQGSDLAFISSP